MLIVSFKAFSGKLPGGVSPLFQRITHGYNTRGSSSNLYLFIYLFNNKTPRILQTENM